MMKINKIYYDKRNRHFRITIPPEMIGKGTLGSFKRDHALLDEYKKSLEEEGMEINKIKEAIKIYKEKNAFMDLYITFLKIEDNLNIISFYQSSKGKVDFSDKTKLDIMDSLIRRAKEHFSEGKEGELKEEISKNVLDVINELSKQNELNKSIWQKIGRFMVYTGQNMADYVEDDFFKEYIELESSEKDALVKFLQEDKALGGI